MGPYLRKPELNTFEDLDQGDILTDMIWPLPLNAASIMRRHRNTVEPAKPDEIAAFDTTVLRIQIKIDRATALVVSNSCDIAQGGTITFARVLPFPETQDEDELWRKISGTATGTGAPKHFYLADDPHLGLQRSIAELHALQSVDWSFIDACLKHARARRVCGLSQEAVLHLRWKFGLVYSRNPRDDFAWASDADIELKRKHLEKEIAEGRFRDKARSDLEKLEAEVARRKAEATREPPSPIAVHGESANEDIAPKAG
jgi:hypothetical protein